MGARWHAALKTHAIFVASGIFVRKNCINDLKKKDKNVYNQLLEKETVSESANYNSH